MSARKRLWRAALAVGAYREWRDACEQAAREGMTLREINRILGWAYLINVLAPIAVVVVPLAISSVLFGWPR